MRSHDEGLRQDSAYGDIDDDLLAHGVDLVAEECFRQWPKDQQQHVAKEDHDEGAVHHEEPGGNLRRLSQRGNFQHDSHQEQVECALHTDKCPAANRFSGMAAIPMKQTDEANPNLVAIRLSRRGEGSVALVLKKLEHARKNAASAIPTMSTALVNSSIEG
jgi:hypothetical protein